MSVWHSQYYCISLVCGVGSEHDLCLESVPMFLDNENQLGPFSHARDLFLVSIPMFMDNRNQLGPFS